MLWRSQMKLRMARLDSCDGGSPAAPADVRTANRVPSALGRQRFHIELFTVKKLPDWHRRLPLVLRRERDRSLSHRRLHSGCYWLMMKTAMAIECVQRVKFASPA